jgi:ElaB/YqjD/DUF883 family membrane-anchored ribosome-binding protein
MDDSFTTSDTQGTGGDAPAKERFAKAMEEAKAGAQALGKEAQDRADLYREKISSTSGEWAEQAKERASGLAIEGKAKASEAIAGLGKLVADNAGLIDEKVGPKYGEYARSAGQSIQDAAARLEAKELNDLADDAKEFVRNSPGLAIGLAAVAGFVLARAFKGSSD